MLAPLLATRSRVAAARPRVARGRHRRGLPLVSGAGGPGRRREAGRRAAAWREHRLPDGDPLQRGRRAGPLHGPRRAAGRRLRADGGGRGRGR